MVKTYKSKSAPSLFDIENTIRKLKDDNNVIFFAKRDD